MEFEVLKRSRVKRNIIIGVFVVFIISAIILNFTSAKYRVSDSVPIINSEINYKVPDLNMVSLYIANEEGTYTEADIIPTSGYTLNTEQSYCGQSNNGEIVKDDTASIVYENGLINVNGISKKGTKCYLYFNEKTILAVDTILAGKDIQTRNDFSTLATNTTTGVIYETLDWKGTSYYFAGNPTDNWVYFGGFYWRIVRVNGDGSVRLIYNGIDTVNTGTGTMINNGEEIAFNSSYNRSEYVGLKYTIGQQHGQTTDSTILNALQSWYVSSNLDDYVQYIDTNIGFCSDRNTRNNGVWSSTGVTVYYAAFGRLGNNKSPSLACSSNDIIFEPVGLITADEVAFAGGASGNQNQKYFLYNMQAYWAMSPSDITSSYNHADVFLVDSNGNLVWGSVNAPRGVRPVINLKSDVRIEGSGTASDPYTVVGA